jgi:hypothetical protein
LGGPIDPGVPGGAWSIVITYCFAAHRRCFAATALATSVVFGGIRGKPVTLAGLLRRLDLAGPEPLHEFAR